MAPIQSGASRRLPESHSPVSIAANQKMPSPTRAKAPNDWPFYVPIESSCWSCQLRNRDAEKFHPPNQAPHSLQRQRRQSGSVASSSVRSHCFLCCDIYSKYRQRIRQWKPSPGSRATGKGEIEALVFTRTKLCFYCGKRFEIQSIFTFVLVYPPNFLVTEPIPAKPTMPKVIRNGCQEKKRQPASGGCVAAMYPPRRENTIKTTNSKLYFWVVIAAGWCISKQCSEQKIWVRSCSIAPFYPLRTRRRGSVTVSAVHLRNFFP